MNDCTWVLKAREEAAKSSCQQKEGVLLLVRGVVGDGYFGGCNTKRPSMSAVSMAIGQAKKEGMKKFGLLVFSCKDRGVPERKDVLLMKEFADRDSLIYIDEVGQFTMDQLLEMTA